MKGTIRYLAPPMMIATAIIALSLAPLSCGSAQPIVTDVVDCVKAEAVVVAGGYSITQIVNAVNEAIDSIATGGVAAALAVLSQIATKWGPDLVACVIDDYPASGGAGSGGGSATPPALARAQLALDPAIKAQLLQQFAPNKKFNHGRTK